MKNISIRKITGAALISLGLLGTGCAKMSEFGNTNVNPNGISTPVTSALLTNALSQVGGFAANVRRGVYAQYISENQYTETSLYALPLLEHAPTYSGPLQDLQTIIDYNSDPKTAGLAVANGSNANQIGIARILKAYIYWTVTDAWGDVPYSEALQGAANLTPKFDKQEDIYFGIIKECKEAVAAFDNGAPIKGDILYGGSTAKWTKLANSLRMLMALRLTNKYPAAGGKAAVEFADAAAGPHIDNNADNAVIQYPGGAFQNPWYLVYQTRDDYASSKTLGDILGGLSDSRSTVFGTSGPMFPYGLTRDLAIAYGNSVGNAQSRVLALSFRQPSSPVTVIGASIVLLARAEAKERGWIAGGTGGAETDYNAGITASFNEWGLSVPAGYLTGASNYNSGAGVPGSIGAGSAPYDNFRVADNNLQNAATPDKLKRIALQYYIASFPNGNEGWSNQRRTGVPFLTETRFKTGKFVNRYTYGSNSYALNNANTVAAAASIGGDVQETKVWWDN
jgi:Starch-binding associating with outer membrane